MVSGSEQKRRAPRAVFLVGLMGAGKTTVGQALADRLGDRFVDTDAAIEAETQLAVSEIFEQRGEAAFREIERAVMLREAALGGVIALGGGAYAQPGAPEALRERGLCIHLKARVETLCERTAQQSGRPLLAGLALAERHAKLAALLAARGPAYARADWQIDVDERSPEEVASAIAAWLQTHEWSGSSGCPPEDVPSDGPN